MRDVILFPRPRELDLTEGLGPTLDHGPRPQRIAGMPPESFEIDGLTLRYGDEAGRRYGMALLGQIRAQCTTRWPELRVRDSPDFPVRGFLLDVSHGRVPNRACLSRLVELLALARFNHLQLYTEHTFAYGDHERVWRAASPLTPSDLRWLDALCGTAGITLAANQNCFDHMGRWLADEAYLPMADAPGGIDLDGRHLPPSSLRPGPDTAAFALSLFAELLPHFSARIVNINCAEPVDLGRGASARDVAGRGRATVYAEQLGRIAGPLLAEGNEVLFWGDMLRDSPQTVPLLPQGATALAWTYDAPNDGSGFGPVVAPFADAGYPFWVVPGTSTWNSLVGRFDNAKANLLDASAVGLARGAAGFLVADWGGDGHLQPPTVSFPPLVFGGAVAWCAEANRALDVPAVLNRFVFDDPSGNLGQVLDRIGGVWSRTGRRGSDCSPLQAALLPSQPHVVTGRTDPDQLRETIAVLDDARAAVGRSTPSCSDATQILHEIEAAIRLARHGALRLSGDVHDPAELAADLAEAIDLHRTAWHGRSRTGGLDLGTRALQSTLHEYRVR